MAWISLVPAARMVAAGKGFGAPCLAKACSEGSPRRPRLLGRLGMLRFGDGGGGARIRGAQLSAAGFAPRINKTMRAQPGGRRREPGVPFSSKGG